MYVCIHYIFTLLMYVSVTYFTCIMHAYKFGTCKQHYIILWLIWKDVCSPKICFGRKWKCFLIIFIRSALFMGELFFLLVEGGSDWRKLGSKEIELLRKLNENWEPPFCAHLLHLLLGSCKLPSSWFLEANYHTTKQNYPCFSL